MPVAVALRKLQLLSTMGQRSSTKLGNTRKPTKRNTTRHFYLTGINNEMVRNAPIFDDISEKVLELLTDRIFVAHNVNWDYSFVRHQLEESTFQVDSAKTLYRSGNKKSSRDCVPTACEIVPFFGHPFDKPTPCGGWCRCYSHFVFPFAGMWDVDREIEKMIKKSSQDQRLPPNLPPCRLWKFTG